MQEESKQKTSHYSKSTDLSDNLEILMDEASVTKDLFRSTIKSIAASLPTDTHVQGLLRNTLDKVATHDDSEYLSVKNALIICQYCGEKTPIELFDKIVATMLDPNENFNTIWEAVRACAAMGKNASGYVVSTLTSLLNHDHSSIRWQAGVALGKIGHSRPDILQQVLPLLGSKTERTRLGVGNVLAHMNLGNDALSILAKQLRTMSF